MIRTRPLVTIMMAAALAGLATLAGCNGAEIADSVQESDEQKVGSMKLNLLLPDGDSILSVHYEITGNGITPIAGDIPVEAAGATISTAVSGIPAGTGYLVTLTATSVGGKDCGSMATFDITPGGTTSVMLTLQCVAPDNTGTVRIDADVNQCPTIDDFSVQPTTQQVGSDIIVGSAASDEDGDTLATSWADAPDGGSFAAATSASTTFRCELGGPTTLTVSVDDGKGCVASRSATVTCVSAAVCGANGQEPGEQCDDGNTDNTDACVNCRNAFCGDGFVQAGVEECDPAVPGGDAGCTSACVRTNVCGNGGAPQPGEECEDGNTTPGDGCDQLCRIEACNGVRVDVGEACDGTNGPNGPLPFGQTCAPDCSAIVDACRACEDVQCRDWLGLGIDLVAGCFQNPDPTFNQTCIDVLSCARLNKCAYDASGRGIEECYCGTANPADCENGVGINGACRSIIETAAGTTDPRTVLVNLGNRNLPLGNATFMLQCDIANCGSTCVPQ